MSTTLTSVTLKRSRSCVRFDTARGRTFLMWAPIEQRDLVRSPCRRSNGLQVVKEMLYSELRGVLERERGSTVVSVLFLGTQGSELREALGKMESSNGSEERTVEQLRYILVTM